MKVLGIDPGTLNLGWGFIETDKKQTVVRVAHDSLHVSGNKSFFERLHLLSVKLEQLTLELEPDVAVIEKIFLGKSVDSAFKLGHIRGICAAHCAAVGAQVVEYTPRAVKKQITGSGSAEKVIVQNFLHQHLRLGPNRKSLDASDALALAFCHILHDSGESKKRGMRPL